MGFGLYGSCVAYRVGGYSNHNVSTLNCTILGDSEKIVDTAARPPPPPPPRPPPLPSRPEPASNQLWYKCLDKGCIFNWAMRTDDRAVGPFYKPARDTAASPYQSQDDLRKWYWFPYPQDKINEKYDDFYGTWGIGYALDELGLSAYRSTYEGGENYVYVIDHENPARDDVDHQWYQIDGKSYRATGASYGFSINSAQGVIIGMNRLSPKNAAKERNPPVPDDELPGLNQFSDVAWIGWESQTKDQNHDIKGLRYFISVTITNEETLAVVQRALGAKGWRFRDWPGYTFEDRQSPEMRAIMGTPNIQGFAYFLIQHKAQLGNMYISKLQVFNGETSHESQGGHFG
ncbi:conserved hypothetical protein [Pyrenophora tritici-repentis Pt-1C-BFP]|uniref:Uncharacterized protein n=1 Tax=Pyrenophora tritici-repentis (strain Pt-1C-BFP) TaxID=426418 RepID=B2VVY6_PYRTR|nr:uncharacterized protein PTRG_01348 [Pyrenophora tritici-repentis Pt-1C-BFP]EDU40786.1 conserved hypothetical protein [Pyrenophora tritici-repentis Pt-1C-BFP]